MVNSIVKGNRGYALVTVLLIITVFIILFLGFVGQSFNTVKQNQIIENNSQSAALAEMGVTYGIHFFENVIPTADEILSQLNDKDENEITEDDILKEVKRQLDNQFQMIKKTEFIEPEKAWFTISSNEPIQIKEKKIIIEFVSTGEAEGRKTAIQSSLEIDYFKFDNQNELPADRPVVQKNPIPEQLPTGNEISEPNVTTLCNSAFKDCLLSNQWNDINNDFSLNDTKVKVNGNLTINGEVNSPFSNTTLYIKENVTFNTNSPIIFTENSHFYVGGTPIFKSTDFLGRPGNQVNVYFGNIAYFNHPSDSNILNIDFTNLYANNDIIFNYTTAANESNLKINGKVIFNGEFMATNSNGYFENAEINHPFTLDNTHIYVQQLTNNWINNNVTLSKGSYLYIENMGPGINHELKINDSIMYFNGDSTFNSSINLSNNAKLCMNGNILLNHPITGNSGEIYINGDLTTNKQIDNDSIKIYAKRVIDNTNSNSGANVLSIDSINFNEKCKPTVTDTIEILDEPFIKKFFDYIYD